MGHMLLMSFYSDYPFSICHDKRNSVAGEQWRCVTASSL